MHEPYTSPPRNANGLTYARYPTPLTHSLHSEPTAVNPEPFCPDTSGLPYTRYRGTVRRTDLEERPAGCETAAARRVGFLISLDSGRMTFFRPGSLHPRRSLLRATCGGSSRVRGLLLEFAPSRLQGPRKALRVSISKSILDRFVNFWQHFPTKWLQNRPQIPKPSPGIPPHRAFCGVVCEPQHARFRETSCSSQCVQSSTLSARY